MSKGAALLFLPDISGFTNFVQNTELEHSQHVIAELLELLLASNSIDLTLAEIEGDALFFYRDTLPTAEEFHDQVLRMFTAFHEHLALLRTHRICPCNACQTAPDLQLKIVAHCGPLEFITVREQKKPFGSEVIEAHRLMKNSIASDSYLLVSDSLHRELNFSSIDHSAFHFSTTSDTYDGKDISYHYAVVDSEELRLKPPKPIERINFTKRPDLSFEMEFGVPRNDLYEIITNYSYRHLWNKGVDTFKFSENEVTRIGSQHACVINNQNLDFEAITKDANEGQLVYGEMTHNPPPFVDSIYQFMTVEALSTSSSRLTFEIYLIANSWIKKAAMMLFGKNIFHKNLRSSLGLLQGLVENGQKTT